MESTTEKTTKNPIRWAINYVSESKEEINKVTWPSREETIRYSLLVMGISLAVGAFFAGMDWLLKSGLEHLVTISA